MAMALLFDLDHVYGSMTRRQALHFCLDFYEMCNEKEKQALKKVLRAGCVDSGNVFCHMLEMADTIRMEPINEDLFPIDELSQAREVFDLSWPSRKLEEIETLIQKHIKNK